MIPQMNSSVTRAFSVLLFAFCIINFSNFSLAETYSVSSLSLDAVPDSIDIDDDDDGILDADEHPGLLGLQWQMLMAME